MKRLLPILLFPLVIPVTGKTQLPAGIKIDSLFNLLKEDKQDTNKVIHLNNLCSEYNNRREFDTALHYGASALQLARQLGFDKGMAAAFNNISLAYLNQGNRGKALEYRFNALAIRKAIGYKPEIANAYDHIGTLFWNLGNYEKALDNYFNSLKIREDISDKPGIAASYNNIGIIYYQQGDRDKALKFLLASLKIEEEIHDKPGIAESFNNIGIIHHETGNYDKALEYLFASLKIKEELNNKIGVAGAYNNIGDSFRKKGETEKALKYYSASLRIFEEIKEKKGIATVHLSIGDVYADRLNYTEAISSLRKGLQIAKEIESMPLLFEAYKRLSAASEKSKDFFNAYEYYMLYSKLKDSIFNEEKSRQIAEMQIKYETEKKEKEIETQSRKLLEQETSLNHNRLLFLFLGIGTLLLFSLAWVSFTRFRIKKESQINADRLKNHELLTRSIIETQENERKRMARDLHDGIGHKLTVLKFHLENLASHINSDSPEKMNLLEQAEEILNETSNEARALSHSIMPKALQVKELDGAVSDLAEQTLGGASVKYSLMLNSPPELPENIQICLYRVLQELLNNILKHSQASEAAIQIFYNKIYVIMIVEDNGIGIKTTSKINGIGLSNITGRVNALNGTFTLEQGPVKGMVMTIRIPHHSLKDNQGEK